MLGDCLDCAVFLKFHEGFWTQEEKQGERRWDIDLEDVRSFFSPQRWINWAKEPSTELVRHPEQIMPNYPSIEYERAMLPALLYTASRSVFHSPYYASASPLP